MGTFMVGIRRRVRYRIGDSDYGDLNVDMRRIVSLGKFYGELLAARVLPITIFKVTWRTGIIATLIIEIYIIRQHSKTSSSLFVFLSIRSF
jgi:hypothetical protein